VLIAVTLLAYAAGAGVLGPRLIRRATWPDKAPMLAIAGYLAAAWSVIAAIALAGLTLAVHGTALGGGLSDLIGACVRRLRDTYATPGGTAATVAGLALAGTVLAGTILTGAARSAAARRGGSAAARPRPARAVPRPGSPRPRPRPPRLTPPSRPAARREAGSAAIGKDRVCRGS
jgi:hypothetical protein